MGLLDIPCDGCGQKLPVESAPKTGAPSDGYVKNVGGTFNVIAVCPNCWEFALERGFNLDESKDVAKSWKEQVKNWKDEPNKQKELASAASKRSEGRKKNLEIASKEMLEELTSEVMQLVEDILLPNEKIICKIRSSKTGDRSQLVLTNNNLIIINKGLSGGQGQDSRGLLGTMMAMGRVSVRVYPIAEIRSVEFQPLQGMSVGHFQVLTNATSENDNESKFLFDTDIGYYKSILLYRKIRQLQFVRTAPQRTQTKPASP